MAWLTKMTIGWIESLEGMRKLVFCLLISILAGVPLLLSGYINGEQWAEVAKTALTIYGAGNVSEHAIKAAKDWFSRGERQ